MSYTPARGTGKQSVLFVLKDEGESVSAVREEGFFVESSDSGTSFSEGRYDAVVTDCEEFVQEQTDCFVIAVTDEHGDGVPDWATDRVVRTEGWEDVLAKRVGAYLSGTGDGTERIYERITDGFFATDDDWRFTYVNERAEELLQRTAEELIGKNGWEEFPEARDSVFWDGLHKAMEEGKPVEFEDFYEPLDSCFRMHAYPSENGISVFFKDITEEKRREQELKEARERYRKMVEESDDGAAIVKGEKWEYVNESLAEMLGEDADEIVGQEFHRWFVGEDEDLVKERYGERFEGESPESRYDATMETADGEHIEVEVRATRIEYDGNPATLGTLRDVTEQRRRERELKRYKAFVENSSDVVTLLSEDGTFEYNSPSVKGALGYEQGELVGEDVFEYVHPEDKDGLLERFRSLLEDDEKEKEKAVFRLLGEDGEYRWFESVATDRTDSDIDGVVVNGRDITERVETERELRIKTRAMEKADISFCLTDPKQPDNPIVYVNQGFEELTGYDEEEAVGKNCRFLQGEDTDPKNVAKLREAVEKDEPADVEILNYKKDGTPFWNRIYISPIYEDGEVVQYVGSQRDVTDTKKREKSLKKANARLNGLNEGVDAMASGASRQKVREAAVKTVENVASEVEYYVWDSDTGKLGTVSGTDMPEEAKKAYVSGETKIVDGSMNRGFCVPVGKDGVLYAKTDGSKEVEGFIDSVKSSAEGALDRVRKREEVMELTEELEERKNRLKRLSETDEAVRKMAREIPEANDVSMEEKALEALTSVEGWSFGWIAAESDTEGYDIRAATNRYSAEAVSEALTGDVSPVEKAFSEGGPIFVDDIPKEEDSEWRKVALEQGYMSCAALPVQSSGTTGEVLELYSDRKSAFGGDRGEVLIDAAAMFGYAIESERKKRLSLEEGYTSLSVSVPGARNPLVRVAKEVDGEVTVESCAATSEGYLVHATVEGDGGDVRDYPGVESIGGSSLRVKCTNCEILEAVNGFGGRVRRCEAKNGEVTFGVDLPSEDSARRFVESVSSEYPGTSLIAMRTETKQNESESVAGKLTERELEAVRTAQAEGFFEIPRETTGEEVAELMDVTAPTVHRHIRSAQKKLIEGFL
jgi:PAS domain S-box-containing protein